MSDKFIVRNHRGGFLRRNLPGNLTEAEYYSFVPSPLPPNPPLNMNNEMMAKLEVAETIIKTFNDMTEQIPDTGMFLSMYERKEALISAQIEGTQVTLEDTLDPDVDKNAGRDTAEVIDHVRAIHAAVDLLKELPLCMKLLRRIHAELMAHSRGKEKDPGEVQQTQNWVGGSSPATAAYVPPNPEDMQKALKDLEFFIHDEQPMNPLVKTALIHYQFETIHPFLDGNGRIGRILLLLCLMQYGVIREPCLYVSYFLKKHRSAYYDSLTDVRKNGTYEQWIKFFLDACAEAAQDAYRSIVKLGNVRRESEALIRQSAARASTQKKWLNFLGQLEKTPIVNIKSVADASEISFRTVSLLVQHFEALGILKETSGHARNRVFAYEKYLSILRRDTEPL